MTGWCVNIDSLVSWIAQYLLTSFGEKQAQSLGHISLCLRSSFSFTSKGKNPFSDIHFYKLFQWAFNNMPHPHWNIMKAEQLPSVALSVISVLTAVCLLSVNNRPWGTAAFLYFHVVQQLLFLDCKLLLSPRVVEFIGAFLPIWGSYTSVNC